MDSLGKFSVVKMDIEGAEGKVMKNGEWLDHVKQIAIELHGRENIEAIPQLLRNKGFVIRFMTGNDLVKNALKNSFLHPISFIKAEARTKVVLNYFKRKYDVPALSREEYKILYGRK